MDKKNPVATVGQGVQTQGEEECESVLNEKEKILGLMRYIKN